MPKDEPPYAAILFTVYEVFPEETGDMQTRKEGQGEREERKKVKKKKNLSHSTGKKEF